MRELWKYLGENIIGRKTLIAENMLLGNVEVDKVSTSRRRRSNRTLHWFKKIRAGTNFWPIWKERMFMATCSVGIRKEGNHLLFVCLLPFFNLLVRLEVLLPYVAHLEAFGCSKCVLRVSKEPKNKYLVLKLHLGYLEWFEIW